MGHDSRPIAEPQIFSLDDAVVIVYHPDLEEPDPEPPEPHPPPTYKEEAARTLMRLHPFVQRMLRRWGVPARDIPDLAQTVIVHILEWWSKRCDDPTAAALRDIRAYIAVIARHAAHRHCHRTHHRAERLTPDNTLFDLHDLALPQATTEPSPEDAVLAHEAAAELAAELDLDKLAAATEPCLWRAFYAYAVLNVPVDIIAESERAPVPTIYNRIRLAREDLQMAVRRHRARRRG